MSATSKKINRHNRMRSLSDLRTPAAEARAFPFISSQSGFTLLEIIVTMAFLMVVYAISAPRIKDGLEKINVRSAKVAVANYVARTRSAAVGRSCRTVFHVAQGTTGRIWITSCRPSVLGRSLEVDSVG